MAVGRFCASMLIFVLNTSSFKRSFRTQCMRAGNATMLAELPSLDLIRGFEAAARNLSFTKAAEELYVTQSAVSRQVKMLEEHLGIELFERRHRALLLTETGQEFYRAATSAMKLLAESASRIKDRGQNRILTVSATIGFISLWLIPRLAEFRALHPEIDIRIDANNKMHDLRQGDIEVAIRYCPTEMAPEGAVKLFGEEVLPVCSPKILTRSKPLQTAEDLQHHVLLHLDIQDAKAVPWLTWTVWLEVMQAAHIKPHGALRFNQYDQVIQAALDGQGVALGSSALVRHLLRDGRLIAPLPKASKSQRAYFALTAPQHEHRADVIAFVNWLKEQAKGDSGLLSAAIS
jgi:DNA-binding transcriptional LysR family regulator